MEKNNHMDTFFTFLGGGGGAYSCLPMRAPMNMPLITRLCSITNKIIVKWCVFKNLQICHQTFAIRFYSVSDLLILFIYLQNSLLYDFSNVDRSTLFILTMKWP